MKKIGFFGGCFNPPTIAHLELMKEVINQFGLDMVYFVPMNDYYNKPELVSVEHRINMIKLLTKDENNMRIADFETKLNKRLYAIDAFEYIDKNFDGDKYFIMGSDNYIRIKNWKDSEKLEKYNYIILDRLHDIKIQAKVNLVSNNNFSNISSSIVRKKIALNDDVSDYLVPDVFEYIKKMKLYKKEV